MVRLLGEAQGGAPVNAVLGDLQHTLETHARGPAMSARELGAAGEVLSERALDILIALGLLALVACIC